MLIQGFVYSPLMHGPYMRVFRQTSSVIASLMGLVFLGMF